ncbi:hypothetical protein ABZ281_43890, partial [Streptomyces sp. NPDC006265]|uniref:hypothetical protein n=1 Tax=Streptomyces sp. NPDC006265 TaxID=3156740 RepID=UPI0033B48BFA
FPPSDAGRMDETYTSQPLSGHLRSVLVTRRRHRPKEAPSAPLVWKRGTVHATPATAAAVLAAWRERLGGRSPELASEPVAAPQ